MESNKLFSDSQFGFRKFKSTEDAAHKLVNSIASRLDQGLKCYGVFLDLAKAFDTVSVPILLRKLEGLGIRGTALDWFSSYLSNRQQLIHIDGMKSLAISINYGVPQGSILGPLLFITYMNDIHYLKLDSAELVCYADDTAILFYGHNWEKAKQVAEKGLYKINIWLQKNLLTLNTNKTKYICFHKTAKSQPPPMPDLRIHTSCAPDLFSSCCCKQILRTNEIKYLGLIIDEHLNFASHIGTLTGRIRKVIGIMKLLRNSANIQIIKLVYFAICQSLLSYCIGVWGGAAKTIMLPLERAQRAVLKTMLYKPFRFSTNALYKEVGVLRVRQLYIHKACVSTHKLTLKSTEYNSLLKKRIFILKLPLVNSSFAKRFQYYAYPCVYNKVSRLCPLKHCSTKECSIKILNLLKNLDYECTENILSSTVIKIGII
ncbi:hypothetical protein O3G_MSEX005813 [Manduca sexta]|uniref:Reverse transcriptase domain-containing protein n=1 Tax=Manduca sexta TaxID=7130 RepID=A0A921YZZ0_MANSE|nr:hypothetical protein O3G_MSEX005813 [Manduca sexta]